MNKSGIVDIELWQLIAAYAYVIVLLVIVRIMGIKALKNHCGVFHPHDTATDYRRYVLIYLLIILPSGSCFFSSC